MLIVGYGATGRELGRRAEAFGVKVIGVRSGAPLNRHAYTTESAGFDLSHVKQLDGLLPQADIVVNLLPNTEKTQEFFSREILMRMRPGTFFANVGRGATVDETALAELLASGHLGGAGLDVFATEPLPEDSHLWELPNVQITPHLAGVGHPILWERLVDLFAGNLRRFLDGDPLENVVDKEKGY
jgi:phosphoglycerate dehydrogenase-like enzyme